MYKHYKTIKFNRGYSEQLRCSRGLQTSARLLLEPAQSWLADYSRLQHIFPNNHNGSDCWRKQPIPVRLNFHWLLSENFSISWIGTNVYHPIYPLCNTFGVSWIEQMLLHETWWCRLTCDGFSAGLTLLSIQVTKTLEAVRAVVPGGEVLTCELCRTVGAHETLLMPRLIPIRHATFGQGLKTQVTIYQTWMIFRIIQAPRVPISSECFYYSLQNPLTFLQRVHRGANLSS